MWQLHNAEECLPSSERKSGPSDNINVELGIMIDCSLDPQCSSEEDRNLNIERLVHTQLQNHIFDHIPAVIYGRADRFESIYYLVHSPKKSSSADFFK